MYMHRIQYSVHVHTCHTCIIIQMNTDNRTTLIRMYNVMDYLKEKNIEEHV